MAHDTAERIIEQPDQKRDCRRDEDDHERVRDRRLSRRPDDMREFFAHMFQIWDECIHGRFGSVNKKALRALILAS